MDEFTQVEESRKGPGVTGWWDKVLPDLTEQQATDLLAAAKSRDISHRTIAIVLSKWGFETTSAQVGHWRRNHVR